MIVHIFKKKKLVQDINDKVLKAQDLNLYFPFFKYNTLSNSFFKKKKFKIYILFLFIFKIYLN